MTTTNEEPVAVWMQILHELETDLRHSESALSATPAAAAVPAGAWRPPAGVPPLPVELLPRARELQARQERLTAALAVARVETLAQLRALSPRAGAARTTVRPAYLDIQA